MSKSSHQVVALTYNGLCAFEFGIAVEVFGLPRPEFKFPWYKFSVLPTERGRIRTTGGLLVESSDDSVTIDQAQTVVVPGWRNYQERPPDRILNLVRRAQANGSRLVSLCGGAFVLAEAGVLDGRRVATHWMFVDELRRRYSKIDVNQEALYIDEGDVLTSAGSAAGIDLCLHIVRKDYGSIIANHVAKRLLAQPYRDGGQSQFIEAPVPAARTGSLSEIMDWMTANLNKDITLPKLAKRARMSERSFYRHFKMTTGLTPKDWLIKERVRQAQRLLEGSRRDIDDIATACGFGSSEALRYQFRRLVRTSPKAYQNAFRGTPGN